MRPRRGDLRHPCKRSCHWHSKHRRPDLLAREYVEGWGSHDYSASVAELRRGRDLRLQDPERFQTGSICPWSSRRRRTRDQPQGGEGARAASRSRSGGGGSGDARDRPASLRVGVNPSSSPAPCAGRGGGAGRSRTSWFKRRFPPRPRDLQSLPSLREGSCGLAPCTIAFGGRAGDQMEVSEPPQSWGGPRGRDVCAPQRSGGLRRRATATPTIPAHGLARSCCLGFVYSPCAPCLQHHR